MCLSLRHNMYMQQTTCKHRLMHHAWPHVNTVCKHVTYMINHECTVGVCAFITVFIFTNYMCAK